jgi:Mlc titration factor MtfA (ptsG expression regulator)
MARSAPSSGSGLPPSVKGEKARTRALVFAFFRRRRRARLRAAPFPPAWRAILSRNVPLYQHLTPDLRRELEGHVQVLLAEKHFEGCGGLTLTDEMRVTIAAHAALLMLRREPHYYPDLVSILVYPSTYLVPVEEQHGGFVTEAEDERLGESWRRGVVVLAWDAARAGARSTEDGDNVILHEFAHQLDTEDGSADGVPLLDRPSDYKTWARALAPEYERLRERPDESILDTYGAEDPAEFFAVATEAFFEKPHELRERHPELYAELGRFYRLDPAEIVPRPTQ